MQKHLLLFYFIAACHGAFAQSQHTLTFTGNAVTRIEKGATYYYQYAAKDSAGNPVSYTIKKLPSWLHYDAATLTISGKAVSAGQSLVQLVATTQTDTAQQNFMITVYDAQTVNILCLGNSITNGTAVFNSYRRYLWQMLHKAHYNIDLIGSWSAHHMGGDVPDPDFDMDHEGHSGWNAQDIFTPPSWDSVRGNMHTWLQQYTPSVVLIELGTNDVFQCRSSNDVIQNLTDACQLFRNKKKDVKIFIARIPPLGKTWRSQKLCGDSIDYATRINELNKAIALFVRKINTTQSPVQPVDQFTGIDPEKNMYDDIHPNDAGEKIMAQRWFDAIKHYLPTL